MIPQAQRGLNRGRGAIRRHNSATSANPPTVPYASAAEPSSSPQATARRASTGTAASAAADGSLASAAEDGDDLEEPMELSVEPVSPGSFSIFQQAKLRNASTYSNFSQVRDGNVSAAVAAAVPSTFRSSVELQISPPPPPQQQQRQPLQPRPSPPLPSTSSGQMSSFSMPQSPMPRMQVIRLITRKTLINILLHTLS